MACDSGLNSDIVALHSRLDLVSTNCDNALDSDLTESTQVLTQPCQFGSLDSTRVYDMEIWT